MTTDTFEMAEEIIEHDMRGRMRTSPEQRRALMHEFDRGSMTARQFAAYAGIKYSTFSNWLAARRKAASTSDVKDDAPNPDRIRRWLDVVIIPPRPT